MEGRRSWLLERAQAAAGAGLEAGCCRGCFVPWTPPEFNPVEEQPERLHFLFRGVPTGALCPSMQLGDRTRSEALDFLVHVRKNVVYFVLTASRRRM